MNRAQEVLYDVTWQKRRLQMLDRWETEEQTRLNIQALLNYIGRANNKYWKFVRVWRVRNIMHNAMRTAEKHENTVGLRLLKVFDKGLEIEYNRYRYAVYDGSPFQSWDWAKVSLDLTKLYIDDVELFKRLQVYSEKRLYAGGKQHPTDTAATPELAHFVRRMRDVVFDSDN